MFGSQMDLLGDSSGRHEVQFKMEVPETKGIMLKTTKLADYVKFLIKWDDYQTKFNIQLSPAMVIAANVRELLQIHNDLSAKEFNALSVSDVCDMLAKENRVTTKFQFREELVEALSGLSRLDWSRVTPLTTDTFYEGVLLRARIFKRTFQIMMEYNKDHCPEVSHTQTGLAQVFLSLISDHFNQSVLAEIDKLSKYKKVANFIDAYLAQVKKMMHIARQASIIPYEGLDFAKSSAPATRKWPGSSQQEVRRESHAPHHRVSFLGNQELQQEDAEEYFSADSELYEEECAEIEDSEEEIQSKPKLSLLQPPAYGCLNYTLYGKCSKGADCRYSDAHTAAGAAKTREFLLGQLNKEGAPAQRPLRVLRRRV